MRARGKRTKRRRTCVTAAASTTVSARHPVPRTRKSCPFELTNSATERSRRDLFIPLLDSSICHVPRGSIEVALSSSLHFRLVTGANLLANEGKKCFVELDRKKLEKPWIFSENRRAETWLKLAQTPSRISWSGEVLFRKSFTREKNFCSARDLSSKKRDGNCFFLSRDF